MSKEVELPLSKENHDLLMKMHEFLVASQNEELSEKYDLRPAVGIAAIQLGIPKRMCAIHVLDYDEEGNVTKSTDYALANPKIVSYTPKQSYLKTGEACLSVPEDVKGYVPRHAKITVEGFDVLTNKDVKQPRILHGRCPPGVSPAPQRRAAAVCRSSSAGLQGSASLRTARVM